jgi:hypothetical protein
VLLSMTALAPRAEAESEPNDTILSATGPLANHQSYTGRLEVENDRDFYFFYVTSPSSPVTLSLQNLGGGPLLAYVGVSILDASGVPVGTATNIEEGKQGAIALTLEPQKYFVEVFSSLDYGAGYTFETQGGEGAFGAYASIGSRCAAARAASKAAYNRLTKAEAKLQRATARVRRSIYSSRAARRSAQAVYRRAKARVAGKRSALRTARKSQQPWCSIPQ